MLGHKRETKAQTKLATKMVKAWAKEHNYKTPMPNQITVHKKETLRFEEDNQNTYIS